MKNSENINSVNDAKKLGHSYIADKDAKWYSHSVKWFGSSFQIKKKKIDLPCDTAIELLGI